MTFSFAKLSDVTVIGNNTQEKTIVYLGKVDGEDALVRVERLAYDSSEKPKFNAPEEPLGSNDVYLWFVTDTEKYNVIFPATQKHIDKYKAQRSVIVQETPEVYETVTKPYIDTMRGEHIQWVRNILFHGAELESVIHKDENLFLLPDMKWDQKTMDLLYVVCIVTREDIASIRDLRGSHLDWLQNVRDVCLKVVSEKYGLPKNKLRLFVHYQPLYYHFHIHVVNVDHDGLKGGVTAGRAVLLDDIIENVKCDGDYYKKRTLTFELGEKHDLYSKLA